MRKIKLLIFLFSMLVTLHGQHNLKDSTFAEGETVNDAFGNFSYQYNRIITKDTLNLSGVIVTLVFINGNAHTAITYRQEVMNSRINWLKTDNGVLKKEGFVEVVTTSIAPNHIVTWQYSISDKTDKKNSKLYIEKAALLIMNDNFQIYKKIFQEKFFKNR